MANTIIAISKQGVNVNTASLQDLTFTTKYPFSKFDATNPNAYQTIDLTFNVDTSNPTTLNGTTDTLIYSFKHGLNYIPSIWLMWQNQNSLYPASEEMIPNTTYYNFGDDSAGVFTLQSFTPSSSPITSPSPLASTSILDQAIPYYCSDATLYATVDYENVYLKIFKVNYQVFTGSPTYYPTSLQNVTISVRLYVFCEPAISN